MKFRNRPNKMVVSEDGREIWLARHIAVAVTALAIHDDEPYVLVNQRGPGVPNYQGYWNLPCGYLDYDETTQEAGIREVWEECGVDIQPLLDRAHIRFFDQPWDVNSRPGGTKQNVTIHHGFAVSVSSLPRTSNLYNEPNETLDIKWLALREVNEFEFAFDHKSRIAQFVQRIREPTGLDYTRYINWR